MSDPEYIGRIACSIAPCGLVCALCGKPSCKGCRESTDAELSCLCRQRTCCREKGFSGCWECPLFPAGRACFPLRRAAADALPPLCAACGRTAQTRLRRIWPPMKRRACCTIATQCILPAIMIYRKMRRRFYACCGRDPNHDSGRMARLIFAKRCFE